MIMLDILKLIEADSTFDYDVTMIGSQWLSHNRIWHVEVVHDVQN